MHRRGGEELADGLLIAAAEREAQLKALEVERSDIDEWRGDARTEIVEFYEQKGLDRDLAIKVVDQLMVRSPLKTALEYEHGILELVSPAEVVLLSWKAKGGITTTGAVPVWAVAAVARHSASAASSGDRNWRVIAPFRLSP